MLMLEKSALENVMLCIFNSITVGCIDDIFQKSTFNESQPF